MYDFDELCGSDVTTTFAYWLLAERKTLPESEFTLENIKGWMSYHYDIEEQAYTSKMLQTNKRLLKHLQPVSPVTLTERWSPFSLACDILGNPIHRRWQSGIRSFSEHVNRRTDQNIHDILYFFFGSLVV